MNACTGISFLRDTKRVGDLSELAVAYALGRAGYVVSKPYGENSRYDLVIDDGTVISRVQVKTGRLRNGAIIFNTFSTHSHRNGVACKLYVNQVEYFGVYCPELSSAYLVPVNHTAPFSGTLRVRATKNNQDSHVRWAQPYLLSAEPAPQLVLVGPEGVDVVSGQGSEPPS